MSSVNTWELFGRFYGYPTCCVAAFINMEHLVNKTKRQFNGTGYIPCSSCNNLSEAELLATIASNRLCSQPFPEEGDLLVVLDTMLASDRFSDIEKAEIVLFKEDYEANQQEQERQPSLMNAIDIFMENANKKQYRKAEALFEKLMAADIEEFPVVLSEMKELIRTCPASAKILDQLV